MSNDEQATILWEMFVALRRRADLSQDPQDDRDAHRAFRRWEAEFIGSGKSSVISLGSNVIPFPVRPRA